MHPNGYRYDLRLTGGKVPLDPPPGTSLGIVVHHPVYVFACENDNTRMMILQQGDEEYLFTRRIWVGATDKARLIVTEYHDEPQ